MTSLPEPVRARVVALAAETLGLLRVDEIPSALRPVARFAPTKRPRLGAGPIAAALESDPAFRARVAEAMRRQQPELVKAVAAGAPPPAADPVDVAAVAYLLRPERWEELVETSGAMVRRAEDEARAAREAAAAERLREQLATARASARENRERYKAEIDRLKAENATLRRRLGEIRERVAAARDAERSAEAESAAAVARAEAAQAAAEADSRRLRSRLSEAEQALEAARRATREERGLQTARLGLLLDTLADAAAGLRRELALPASGLRPADTVSGAEPGEPGAPDHARARTADDPAHLAELLALPRSHLIIDGYNVTKTAWPAMPLESQRNRLVNGLGPLASRTGAEVTCVFDGSDVAAPPPVTAAQGVRVRFSTPGETADDLIRRLVNAEPKGRAVVVVSSDREVADAARSAGYRAVEALALVQLLAG